MTTMTGSLRIPQQRSLCLLHGEYHQMDAWCIDWAYSFAIRHPHLTDEGLRDAMQSAAERLILDRWAKTGRLTETI